MNDDLPIKDDIETGDGGGGCIEGWTDLGDGGSNG